MRYDNGILFSSSSYENSGSGGVAYVSSVYDYSEQNGNHGNSYGKKVGDRERI